MKPKDKINLKTEAMEKFMTWFLDKQLKYGDWFKEWWRKEGSDAFVEWSKIRGQEFIKEFELEKKPKQEG